MVTTHDPVQALFRRQLKSLHITYPNYDSSDVKTICLLDVFQVNDIASISQPSHGGLEGAVTFLHQARCDHSP